MKVLHVYKSYYPYTLGGIEKCIENLCHNMQSYGVSFSVLSVGDCDSVYATVEKGIEKIYYPKTIEKFSCPISLLLLKKFRSIIQQYDLIHYHFPWPFADILSLLARGEKPYVVTYHSDIIRQKKIMPFYYPLMKYFLSKASKIVATSENYLQSSPILKKFQKNVCVIPIGLNDCAHKNYGEINYPFIKKPYFLFMGVLRHYKGLPFLLNAMKGVTDYQFIIAGDGPCFNELKKIIESEKLHHVYLIGRVTDDEKYRLYQHAYGVVVPSHLRNEAYCYTLVEGLMFGKPLISAELNTGTSFVNCAGKTGIIVPPADADGLRNAMDKLIKNKELRDQFAQNARPRYFQYLTGDQMAQSYLNLYHTIIYTDRQ